MAHQTSKQIFFHVGMPKTASTFLQRNVFPHFQNLYFIKKHDFRNHQHLIAASEADKILLSIELNLDAKRGYEKMVQVAQHYPGTQPVIVLRKHSSWLKSKYKYYLRKHGVATFWNYFDPNHESGEIIPQNLRYYDKLKLLETTYGKRPLVFFQEELKARPYEFIAQMAEFMRTSYDSNAISIKTVKGAYSEHQLKFVRRFNRWYQFKNPAHRKKAGKFLYRKFSALLLHTVAFAGRFLPDPDHGQPLIPKESMQEVDRQYQDDWQQCLDYARQDRTLLF